MISSIPLTRKSQVLSEIPLFASLSGNEVEALAQRAVEKRFDAGQMLFWEGEPCAGIFPIAEGSVKIFKMSPSGREMMLALERAPSTVAELPLFDGGAYPASARADEFALHPTHQEIASRLGTVREVVSRNLARFRAQGLSRMQEHTVAILDRAGLEREAEIEA